jgi:hypothetical protein
LRPRIDLDRPEALSDWFGERMKASAKPISHDYVRALGRFLLELADA